MWMLASRANYQDSLQNLKNDELPPGHLFHSSEQERRVNVMGMYSGGHGVLLQLPGIPLLKSTLNRPISAPE